MKPKPFRLIRKGCYLLRHNGQSTVEALLAVAVLLLLAAGIATLTIGSREGQLRAQNESAAMALAREGIDAVRSIRDRDWSALVPGTYGLSDASGLWQFSGISETSGKFTRAVAVNQIARDTFCTDPGSGATDDPDARAILVNVSWQEPAENLRTVIAENEFTRWRAPGQSTCAVGPPPPASCQEFCQAQGFGGGTCRSSCRRNETYQSGGDVFCIAPNNRCCCR